MAEAENVRSLLLAQLRDLYDADKVLLAAWPKLRQLSSSKPLKTLCQEGVSYTKERIRRLDTAFALLELRPAAKKSPAMRALVKSALTNARNKLDKPARDAVLLAYIERISHYGMAGYGVATECARALGQREMTSLLRKSYREKKDAIREEASMMRRSILPPMLKNS